MKNHRLDRDRSRLRGKARPPGQALHEGACPFGADALAPMSRAFAREAAQKVALEGTRYVAGASAPGSPQVAAIRAVPTDEILAAQAGLIADLDAVRDVLYAPFAAT